MSANAGQQGPVTIRPGTTLRCGHLAHAMCYARCDSDSDSGGDGDGDSDSDSDGDSDGDSDSDSDSDSGGGVVTVVVDKHVKK